ncbi:MAG TPA: heme o synthase [Candidatus Tectomicrobia bacterium]
MMLRTLSVEPAVVSSRWLVRKRAMDYLALTKPRVVLMVLVTSFVGFYLASPGWLNWLLLCHTLIGVALAAGGTLALNQYLERDLDARMLRTKERPLPEGRLQPGEALAFGVAITASGLLYLTLLVNPLSGLVTAVSVGSYLFLYTPLKQKTPLCVMVGAVPGALPPVTGWVAASGGLSLEAWVLFAILFLWQIPHSLSIAVLYREDYARANFQLLPVLEPDGAGTGRQIIVHSLALLAIGLLPTTLQLAGPVYFVTAFVLGTAMVIYGLMLAKSYSSAAARRLLFASLIYLPTLLLVMAIDKVRM